MPPPFSLSIACVTNHMNAMHSAAAMPYPRISAAIGSPPSRPLTRKMPMTDASRPNARTMSGNRIQASFFVAR